MVQFKKILVPVDFSEPSKKALAYGMALGTESKAKLIVAHIVPESTALTYAFPTETFAIEKEQYDKAHTEIRNLIPPHQAAELDFQLIVKVGRIEDQLLGIIKDASVDLVVMGTHGRRYLGRWFLGSVTERMLRRVPVPVLTVSHVEGEQSLESGLVSLKRILYATDLSDSAGIGMRYAADLAKQTGAELTIIHVVDFWNAIHEPPMNIADERARILREMRKRLDDFVARENRSGLSISTLTVEGTPYEKILAAAEESGTDVIVLNLQGKGILERAFLGSTAERVVRLARVPVLSVPVVS